MLQSVGGTHSAPQRRCAEAERWACQRGRWGALPDASSPGGGWPSATGHQRAVSPRRRMHSRFGATRLVKCPGQPRTPRPRVAHEDTASTRRTRQTSLCSGPPCVPSPEAQPLPSQPPLPMWTVPDLGGVAHSPMEPVLQTEAAPSAPGAHGGPMASTAATLRGYRTQGPGIPAPPGASAQFLSVPGLGPKGLSLFPSRSWQDQLLQP